MPENSSPIKRRTKSSARLKDRERDAAAELPLPTLLSHALVAFTIEFDNEAERQVPHWTTNYGSAGGSREATWLVSLVMWPNCMQHIGDGDHGSRT